ncbi:MAG: sugar transferase [Anaerolineae bacterium]|nr:sugar transferase [Anaerolineae bacterium]
MSVNGMIDTVFEPVYSSPAVRTKVGLRLTANERKGLLFIVDLILVNISLLAAVTIWNDFSPSWSSLLEHAKWFITLSILWSIAGVVLDVYNLARSASVTSIITSAGGAALASALVYIAIPWLTPPILHRIYVLGLVLFMLSAILVWRVFYAWLLVQPTFRQRALILGAGAAACKLAHALGKSDHARGANPFRGTGYQIVGLVADQVEQSLAKTGVTDEAGHLVECVDEASAPGDNIIALGDAGQLVSLARQYNVDEIIVALDDERGLSVKAYESLLDCRELGLQVNDLATVYERLTGRLPIEYAQRDVRLILGVADSPASRLYAAVKRLVDVFLSLFGLLALAQIIPWVALANALWSPGPLFYKQQRVGKGGQPFALLKFRSMIPDAEKASGAVWCKDKDNRITPVGLLLRKTRLDELPQFINVLRGEMSIVGPRPERPYFVGQLSRVLPLYRARHAVNPGITGWAQVHYEYGNSIEDARIKLEYDLYYVRHASLYMDLLTMLQTVRVVVGCMGQ